MEEDKVWSGPAPIQVLTGIEAVQKRPQLYVGHAKDNNGLNVVTELIHYATDVVCKGGEVFIAYGDGSSGSEFVVRTFEERDLDIEDLFALRAGKPPDRLRHAELGVSLALSWQLRLHHFTKEDLYLYNFTSGKLTDTYKYSAGGNLPGLQFKVTLNLNVVERVPFQPFVEYLAKNPHFHWAIETIYDDSDRTIFRGKLWPEQLKM